MLVQPEAAEEEAAVIVSVRDVAAIAVTAVVAVGRHVGGIWGLWLHEVGEDVAVPHVLGPAAAVAATSVAAAEREGEVLRRTLLQGGDVTGMRDFPPCMPEP